MIAQPLLRSYYLVSLRCFYAPTERIVINLMLHKLNHSLARSAVPQQYVYFTVSTKHLHFFPFFSAAADVTAMINDVASDFE